MRWSIKQSSSLFISIQNELIHSSTPAKLDALFCYLWMHLEQVNVCIDSLEKSLKSMFMFCCTTEKWPTVCRFTRLFVFVCRLSILFSWILRRNRNIERSANLRRDVDLRTNNQSLKNVWSLLDQWKSSTERERE